MIGTKVTDSLRSPSLFFVHQTLSFRYSVHRVDVCFDNTKFQSRRLSGWFFTFLPEKIRIEHSCKTRFQSSITLWTQWALFMPKRHFSRKNTVVHFSSHSKSKQTNFYVKSKFPPKLFFYRKQNVPIWVQRVLEEFTKKTILSVEVYFLSRCLTLHVVGVI